MRLDEEIRPPSSINPRVPEQLERIITRMLEKDPRHRYTSAAALLHDIADVAGKTAPAGELLVGKGELYAAPLIGRKHEVSQLTSLIAEAREGRGSGAILAGAEGMGKSRIVRDATLRAQLDGARVFCGRCPVNRKSIYAPFFEIFEQMVTAVNPDADVAAEIRRLLRPLVTPAKGEESAPPTGQKYRLYNRIVQSMQDMYGFLSAADATGSSLILVIEDLPWADPSTAEPFTFRVGGGDGAHPQPAHPGGRGVDPDGEGRRAGAERARRARVGRRVRRALGRRSVDRGRAAVARAGVRLAAVAHRAGAPRRVVGRQD